MKIFVFYRFFSLILSCKPSNLKTMRKITFLVLMTLSFSLWAQHLQRKLNVTERTRLLSGKIHKNMALRPAQSQLTVLLEEDFNASTSIPSGWTVIDSAGTGAVWQVVSDRSGENLDGTNFVIADSDGAGSVDMNTILESPVISGWNPGDRVFLSFDHYFLYYENEIGDVDVYDGTQWINVAHYQNQDVGSWDSPAYEEIDITPYLNSNLKVRFHYYDANYDWYWAVDNIKVFVPSNTDLAMETWVYPFSWMDGPVPFSCVVYNNGLNVQNDFDVVVTVKDSLETTTVFSDTVHVSGASLAYQDKMKVNFIPNWHPPADDYYSVNFKVIVPGDEDPSNDEIQYFLEIYSDYGYEPGYLYSQVIYDADTTQDNLNVVKVNLTTGDTINLGNYDGFYGYYTLAGDLTPSNDLMYVTDNFNLLYFVDTLNKMHVVGYPYDLDYLIGAVTTDRVNFDQIFMIAYDDWDSKMYVSDLSLNLTYIGTMDSTAITGLAMDNAGTLYGIDIVNDALFNINPADASYSMIGPLNLPLDYAQDMGYDAVNDKLYAMLFMDDNGNYYSGLYEINKSNGTPTLIGPSRTDEFGFVAVLGAGMKIEKLPQSAWNIYPNPVENNLHIQSDAKIVAWNIYDLSGKIVMNGLADGKQASIDVSGLPAGAYVLKLVTAEGRGVKRFMKK